MIHVRKDGVGAVEGGRERGMRGDTEGAFPIPSLPLKGNKESENTRKHLWTHRLCGFWVSPPSSTSLLPCLWGGGGAGEHGGGNRVFVLGFGMSQTAVSLWPAFLGGWRYMAPLALAGLALA